MRRALRLQSSLFRIGIKRCSSDENNKENSLLEYCIEVSMANNANGSKAEGKDGSSKSSKSSKSSSTISSKKRRKKIKDLEAQQMRPPGMWFNPMMGVKPTQFWEAQMRINLDPGEMTELKPICLQVEVGDPNAKLTSEEQMQRFRQLTVSLEGSDFQMRMPMPMPVPEMIPGMPPMGMGFPPGAMLFPHPSFRAPYGMPYPFQIPKGVDHAAAIHALKGARAMLPQSVPFPGMPSPSHPLYNPGVGMGGAMSKMAGLMSMPMGFPGRLHPTAMAAPHPTAVQATQ